MPKVLSILMLVVLFFFSPFVSYTADAGSNTAYISEGCWGALPDGTVYFKCTYAGNINATSGNPYWLWIKTGSSTAVGEFAPSYSNGATHYYFLPPGTLPTPLDDCYDVVMFSASDHSSQTESTALEAMSLGSKWTLCRCEESGECDASFDAITGCNPPNVGVMPNTYNPNWIYDFDYGDGQGYIGWVSLIYNSPGQYRVCLRVITDNGEVCGSCRNICIDSCGNEGLARSVPFNRKEQGLDATSGSLSDMILFPNPTRDRSTLSFNLSHETYIEVKMYSITGKYMRTLLEKVASGKQTIEIDTKDISPGYYMINIDEGDEKITTKLLVIK